MTVYTVEQLATALGISDSELELISLWMGVMQHKGYTYE